MDVNDANSNMPDQKIIGMNTNMLAISTSENMPVYTSIEDKQAVTHKDADLQRLKSYIIKGWPHKKTKSHKVSSIICQSGMS